MRGRLVLGALLGVLAALSAAGLLLVSAWLISRAAEQPPVLYLLVAVVATRAFGVARSVLRYAERLVTHDAALRALTDVRVRVWEGLRRQPGSVARGDAVRRLTADVDAVGERTLRVRLPAVVVAVASAAVVTLVLAVLPSAGVVLAACVAVAGVAVPTLVGLSARHEVRRVAPLGGAVAGLAAEGVRTADELAAAGARDDVVVPLRRAAAELGRVSRRSAWLDGLGAVCVRLALGVAVVAGAWLGVRAVADGTLAPVLLAVVVLAPLALADLLEETPTMAQESLRTRAAVDRLTPLLDVGPAATGPAAAPTTGGPPPRVEVSALRAGWPDGPDVLGGVDLDVAPGSVVAVVGPSGSGKSTLAAVLLGRLAPRSGDVRLDGASYADLGTSTVRAQVGLLGQDEHVFDTTIAENLRIARPDATHGQMWDALERAGLAGLLAASDRGLDTLVGEHGGSLSGGERQRLGLARLLLADRRVLVLDEPTEHLDESTAQSLVRDLLALAPARTLVVLTHQQVWTDHADHVVGVARQDEPVTGC